MAAVKVDYFTDQGSGLMNEDDFLIKDNLFCVFDGVTSLVKYVGPDGITGGKLGSYFTKEIFEQNSEKPLLEIIRLANNKLREEMIKRNIDVTSKPNLWGTTLAAIRITGDYAEYIQVADSTILFISKNKKTISIPTSLKIDRKTLTLLKKLIDQGVKEAKRDERVLALQMKTRNRVNLDYGTLNGEEGVFDFIATGKIPLNNINHILLFTDGVKVLQEDPEKDEDMLIITDLFLKKGLNKLLEYVRNTENSDPECITYPRTKTHDDATAISISF